MPEPLCMSVKPRAVPVDPEKALREEVRLLRGENMRLRARLGMEPASPPTIIAVMVCFLSALAETDYTTPTGYVTMADLRRKGKRNPRVYVRARDVAMWCVRRVCAHASWRMIADAFHKPDHTCVIMPCKRIQPVIEHDRFWRGIASEVLAAFGEKI